MLCGGRSFVSSPPAFSNDGKRLLVCTGNTVSVFSTSTGLQTGELEGHAAQVTAVIVVPASTPAGKILTNCWTASLDETIKYWDFTGPELIRTISLQYPIHSMVIPGLLNPASETSEKAPDLFAYICIEGPRRRERKTDSLGLHIQKCNLTKSRIVRGVTLAEIHRPVSITVSTSGKFIGFPVKRKLRIWEVPARDIDRVDFRKIRLHHTKSFTALAFHPTERTVAAGDITGRILIWRGVGRQAFADGTKSRNGGLNGDVEDRPGVRDNDDADSCTTWHWHAGQVNVLFFSSDGTHLYSGGKEGVLVVWQLDTGKKKFLPRIGSPIQHYINSPDPSLSCISCADNRIHLLEMPSMKILQTVSGIKLPCSTEMYEKRGSAVAINHVAGLIAVPTENYRVQFYSLFDDREISEVQICERNHHPGDEIRVQVNLVALSLDGCTMCTVETRLAEEGIGGLVSLKFWACDLQSKACSLSTIIYEPHREATVSSIAFHPSDCMAVTSSFGGDFKIWIGENTTPAENGRTQTNAGWLSYAVGSYKGKAMTAAAFSGDGSVLAVAAGNAITLWDPYRNILLDVIGDSSEPISSLSFIGMSDYLVSTSQGSNPQLSVWSMSKLSRTWSYKLLVDSVSCSMDNSTFAVLARIRLPEDVNTTEPTTKSAKGIILMFSAENPVPSSMWFVSKAQGGGLSFLSSNHMPEDEAMQEKTSNELLAFLNPEHEYVIFDPYKNQSSKADISHMKNFGIIEEPERYGYASIYGELPEFSLPTDQTPVPLDKSWKTIFYGPSHILPPLDKLCSDFLESLLERRPTAVE